MRIASKINTALIGVFACGTVASYVVLQSTIQPRFEEIERSQAQLNHKRVTDAIEASTEKLQTATQDYAFWDETYGVMHGEGVEDFITSNLTPDVKAVTNLRVNALLFQKPDGSILWGRAFDLETEKPIDGLVESIAEFVNKNVSTGTTLEETVHGLVATPNGLVLVAIAPVLKGDHSGEPSGHVATAKLFNAAAFKELTGVEFNIEALAQADPLKVPSEDVALRTFNTSVVTTSVLKSAMGQPLALLHVTSDRNMSRVGAHAISSALIMMMLAALIACGILWAYLAHSVVKPLSDLSSHFATAGSSGRIRPAALAGGEDELDELAQSFNTMADQVNHLRDALADSAYMSGLSEWAAGTLHNVRNGLMPVTTAAWQIEKLYEGTLLTNIDTAAAEYANEATPPERRQKMNTYLAGSAARLAENARRSTELTRRISEASKSVLEIVSEFERYAHSNAELAPVELLPLIASVSDQTVAAVYKNVTVVLPSTPATVRTNIVILQQVISNVLINAVEAIESNNTKGRIEISIAPHSLIETMTRISIRDNGEGFATGREAEIFRRGVSTRHHRAGGLGLHWCANAVKVLGGTICAASDGPGQGATIIIDLPTFALIKREAA